MSRNYTFLFVCAFFLLASSVQGQMRYVDAMFGVDFTPNVVYGTNLTVVTGVPAEQPLLTDVYSPADDDATDRPAVILMHTGSFLPPYFNGGITGARTDSVVVEMSKRLASRGYVVFNTTYRAGWDPESTNQNQRTGTLLNAAYRGGIDTRTAIRFVKKTVAEDDNLYGVDPERIIVWGVGTGGYNAFTAAFLDDFQELNEPKWVNTETLQLFVDETTMGNPYGTEATMLNMANHASYSSDFAMAINQGGALGDTTWIDGTEDEPILLGFHVVTDPFAPFGNGPVIVPTTQEFVVNVHGTNTAVELANEIGNNDALIPANDAANLPVDVFGTLPATINQINAAYSATDIVYLGDTIKLSHDNMYPFVLPGLQSGPWDWWNKQQLDFIIPIVNDMFGRDFSSDTLHMNGLLTNPDMSPEKGRAYIDTVMAVFIPRACEGLGLDCAPSIVDVDDLIAAEAISLTLAPNPATEYVLLETDPLHPMREVVLYDISGRPLQVFNDVNSHTLRVDRGTYPSGHYVFKVQVDEGTTTRKVFIR